ncbi:MAG: FadR family transcriptional regulator [Xanthomonadaceae bacterium]|nr:FadR family transcriptional regulator [Xanthomonadaceae bacterium]
MALDYFQPFHASKPRSKHDTIARTLGQEILTGVHAPGANLPPEAELLKRFGASRTVLREAMKTLAAKGLVVLKTRVGTRVLNSSNWNFFDAELLAWYAEMGVDAQLRRSLTEIRRAVEPAAAALAAERRSRAEIAHLRDCVRRMARSGGAGEDFAKADLEFHLMIGVASGNPLMRSLAAVIEAALVASFQQNLPLAGDDLRETAASHDAIVDGIEAKDPAAASAAMLRVIDLGQIRIVDRMRARGESASRGTKSKAAGGSRQTGKRRGKR